MTLYTGTSGWAYPEWKPGFYPARLPQGRFLRHYGSRLSACEINATFYKEHNDGTFDRWGGAVPPGFRFALKVHRTLTHGKSVVPDDLRVGRLRTFFESTARLGEHRGPLLFQFPAYRKKDVAGLRLLLEMLPGDLSFAFEFRDGSWDDRAVAETVAAHGGTICLPETEGRAPDALPPGRVAYVRLRGPRYSTKHRAAWRKLLEKEAETRDVFVFTKHEGVSVGDPHGGLGLALWLERYARRRNATATPGTGSYAGAHAPGPLL